MTRVLSRSSDGAAAFGEVASLEKLPESRQNVLVRVFGGAAVLTSRVRIVAQVPAHQARNDESCQRIETQKKQALQEWGVPETDVIEVADTSSIEVCVRRT